MKIWLTEPVCENQQVFELLKPTRKIKMIIIFSTKSNSPSVIFNFLKLHINQTSILLPDKSCEQCWEKQTGA